MTSLTRCHEGHHTRPGGEGKLRVQGTQSWASATLGRPGPEATLIYLPWFDHAPRLPLLTRGLVCCFLGWRMRRASDVGVVREDLDPLLDPGLFSLTAAHHSAMPAPRGPC